MANPASGTVTISNSSAFVHISFSSLATFEVTLFETGLPSGAMWTVSMNGYNITSNTNTINFYEPNGTYIYTINGPSGYTISPRAGALAVAGKAIVQTVTFPIPNTYSVEFQESGLPRVTMWSITLNGKTETSTTNTIIFSGINGSYSYVVNPVTGYQIISGQSKGTGSSGQTISLTFVANSPASIWTTYQWYIIGGAIVLIIILLLAFKGGEQEEKRRGRWK